MISFKKNQIVLLLISLSACKTSGDLANRSRYVDPTEVKTLDAPSNVGAVSGNENLVRENEVLKGEIENLQHRSTLEKADLAQKIKDLESKNSLLSEEIIKLRSGVPTPIEVQGNLPSEKTGAPLLWELARKDILAGQVEKAISPLSELVKNYPKDPKVLASLLNLGACHYKIGNHSDAVLVFNQAIDRFPKKSDIAFAWFGQGASFSQMKRTDDSKLFFDELIRRYPKSAEAKLAVKITNKKEKVPVDLFPLGNPRFSK